MNNHHVETTCRCNIWVATLKAKVTAWPCSKIVSGPKLCYLKSNFTTNFDKLLLCVRYLFGKHYTVLTGSCFVMVLGADPCTAFLITTISGFERWTFVSLLQVMAGGPGFLRPEDELTVRLCFVHFDGAAALAESERLGVDAPLPGDFLKTHCTTVYDGIQVNVHILVADMVLIFLIKTYFCCGLAI